MNLGMLIEVDRSGEAIVHYHNVIKLKPNRLIETWIAKLHNSEFLTELEAK